MVHLGSTFQPKALSRSLRRRGHMSRLTRAHDATRGTRRCGAERSTQRQLQMKQKTFQKEKSHSQNSGNWSLKIAEVEALKGMQMQHQKKRDSNGRKTVVCPRGPLRARQGQFRGAKAPCAILGTGRRIQEDEGFQFPN